MVQIDKFVASVIVMFLFMFSLIFSFDTSDTQFNNLDGRGERAVFRRHTLTH